MRARSLVVTDLSGTESHPRIFELAEEVRIVVGRNRECHVALDPRHRVVSARHAALRLEGARLKVRDLDSHNGTFVEIEGKGRRRLAKGEDALLGAQDAAFVGPYRLSLCEPVGHGVVLTDDSDSSGMNSTQTGAPSEAPPRAFASLPDSTTAAVSALTTAMSADAAVNSWEAVLGGLIELTRPHSAVLLRRREGRFVSRASMGLAPAVPLSRRFVELTAGRDRSWRFSPGDSGLGLLSSPSIVEIGEGVTLTGVPFPARNGETIAVACVEHQDAGHGLDLAALDLFATLAGAMLELGHGLDRETRRREALEHRLRRVRGERGEADAQGGRSALIGSSRAFRDAVELVERVADAEATLLIRGPTGAGKEQLARLAHEASRRRDHPFVVVNCAQLPPELIESELFGHDRGAFTGADARVPGAFERADGGTLFLDELGDLPPQAQAKILRSIESGEVTRLGGSKTQVDIRVVTATHRDLEAMIRDGSFREDLFYRLNVV